MKEKEKKGEEKKKKKGEDKEEGEEESKLQEEMSISTGSSKKLPENTDDVLTPSPPSPPIK
ncbi:hypothetical protein AGMMS49556_09100 [Endomicrobiia bacterium]|nr:hypothetical protein AGMMS49556_09100 [Endomicrobiia bacterium]